jgi:hypothetical protein
MGLGLYIIGHCTFSHSHRAAKPLILHEFRYLSVALCCVQLQACTGGIATELLQHASPEREPFATNAGELHGIAPALMGLHAVTK